MDYKVIIAYACGYFFSVLVGTYFIGRLVDRLWKSIGWTGSVGHDQTNIRPGAWLPPITGFVERILYTTSLLMNNAVFIGVWLAIKVASQ